MTTTTAGGRRRLMCALSRRLRACDGMRLDGLGSTVAGRPLTEVTSRRWLNRGASLLSFHLLSAIYSPQDSAMRLSPPASATSSSKTTIVLSVVLLQWSGGIPTTSRISWRHFTVAKCAGT